VPLTPYHLGLGLLAGLLLLSLIDFPTLLIASIIVDVEPITIVVFHLGYRLHGFFHTFVGGTLIALVLAGAMSKIRTHLTPLLTFFGLEQKASFRRILSSSLLGVYVHILLDSNMHWDIQPFYPVSYNPFLDRSVLPGLYLELMCFWSFIGAVILYVLRLFLIWRKGRLTQAT